MLKTEYEKLLKKIPGTPEIREAKADLAKLKKEKKNIPKGLEDKANKKVTTTNFCKAGNIQRKLNAIEGCLTSTNEYQDCFNKYENESDRLNERYKKIGSLIKDLNISVVKSSNDIGEFSFSESCLSDDDSNRGESDEEEEVNDIEKYLNDEFDVGK